MDKTQFEILWQHAASIYGFVRQSVSSVSLSQKKFRPLLDKVGGRFWYVGCTHKYKINQGVMVGRLPFLGWSPSYHNTLVNLIFVSTVNIPNISLQPCLDVA